MRNNATKLYTEKNIIQNASLSENNIPVDIGCTRLIVILVRKKKKERFYDYLTSQSHIIYVRLSDRFFETVILCYFPLVF